MSYRCYAVARYMIHVVSCLGTFTFMTCRLLYCTENVWPFLDWGVLQHWCKFLYVTHAAPSHLASASRPSHASDFKGAQQQMGRAWRVLKLIKTLLKRCQLRSHLARCERQARHCRAHTSLAPSASLPQSVQMSTLLSQSRSSARAPGWSAPSACCPMFAYY